MSLIFHQCDMSAYGMAPTMCICEIGRDHDADEMERWEENDWQDPDDGSETDA